LECGKQLVFSALFCVLACWNLIELVALDLVQVLDMPVLHADGVLLNAEEQIAMLRSVHSSYFILMVMVRVACLLAHL
jgi:hypothetical protein